jgi:Mg-chelatase subunit ChlD
MRHVILCIDQSGSMAASVVYSAIFGSVLASLPAISTSLVVFDTKVIDLTEQLDDPTDVLFSVRLGGGTDINGAVAYCQQLVRAPQDTVFILISDLFEGGVENEFLKRANALLASGVQFITLLALSDEGAPSFNAQLAAQLAALGAPAFACTPDRFPELMAAAIGRQPVTPGSA